MTRNTRPHRFTLVELLTVIMIIVILTGFLIPAVTTVRERAKQARATTDMKSIEIAIKQYESTYGYLPVAAGAAFFTPDNGEYDDLIGNLTNRDGMQGGRGIVFLELSRPVELTAGEDTMVDPWYDPDESSPPAHRRRYQLVIDANYDRTVTVPAAQGGDDVNGSMAVWSTGKKATDAKDDIYSWK